MIHLLLTHHREAVDISHPDPEGYTAPQLAVVHMRLEILQILLDVIATPPYLPLATQEATVEGTAEAASTAEATTAP